VSAVSLRPVIANALARLPAVLADDDARERALAVADLLPAEFTSGPIGLELRLAGPTIVDLFAAAAPADVTFDALVAGLRRGGWADDVRAADLAEVLDRWRRREGTLPAVARYLLVEADAPRELGAPVAVPSIFLAPRGARDLWRPGQPRNAFQRYPDTTVMAAAELSGVWPDPLTAQALATVDDLLPDEADIFAVGAMISRDAGASLRVAVRRFTPDLVHRLLSALERPRQADILAKWTATAPAARQVLAFEVGPGAEARVGLELSPAHDWKHARLDGWDELLAYIVDGGVADPVRAGVVPGLVDASGDPVWGLAHVKVAANDSGLMPVSKLYVGLLHRGPA
jgi:hypothetical protein